MYAIVRFVEEGYAPGIVCTHWINEDENVCYYPNVKTNEGREKLLQRLADPDKDWSMCRIKVLDKYSSFSIANLHLYQTEDASGFKIKEENISPKPRKRTKSCMYSEEDPDEDCIALPLQKSAKKINSNVIPCPVSRKDPTPTFGSQSQTVPSSLSISSDFQSSSNMPSVNSTPEKQSACSSSQTIMNEKFLAWMTSISDKLKQLENKIDVVLENQEKLLIQQNLLKGEIPEDIEALGELPVNDDDSFVELETKISTQSHLRHLFVKILVSVGGNDMRNHVHNMLRKVLKDEVAELYSLSGKSTLKDTLKKPFLATQVSKSIFTACQKVFKDSATEMNVKEAIGDWLHQAKIRRTRRIQRHEKKGKLW